MDGKVVDLKKYLSIKAVPHYTERKLAVNAHAQSFLPDYNEHISSVLTSLKTNSPKFKFPTVMSGYRRDMNPVSALYENVQEILLKNNKDHKICRWILSLFTDQEWKMALIDALLQDHRNLSQTVQRSNLSSHDKKILQYNIEKFRHYIIVFSSLD